MTRIDTSLRALFIVTLTVGFISACKGPFGGVGMLNDVNGIAALSGNGGIKRATY
jgi:hypothetical protein